MLVVVAALVVVVVLLLLLLFLLVIVAVVVGDQAINRDTISSNKSQPLTTHGSFYFVSATALVNKPVGNNSCFTMLMTNWFWAQLQNRNHNMNSLLISGR